MNTELKNAVKAADLKAQYDARVKRLVGHKRVLAQILIKTVDEFKGMNPKTVANCIEGTPYISTVPVEPGLTNAVLDKNGQRIVGFNTESQEINEGLARFDIVFYVRTKDGLSQIIINVEAQKDEPGEYEILNRAIFYVSRLVSSQKERDFENSRYDDIKRVYSIWVCMNMDENTMDKGMGILEAVTRMANIMGLRMIAEGVETEDQINYLLNMGCIYGQGYFFYKPLPVEEIKVLLNDENNVDYRGIQARKIEHVRFKDLFQSELASDSILNNILGPIAIYDVYRDNVELLQVNDKYCLLVGQDPVDLAENVQVMEAIHPDDRKKMQNIFQRSFQRLAEGAEGTVRRRREDGQYIWINIKAFFLREQDGHKMFYGAVRDVSEEISSRN